METKTESIEVLAPAGSFESLRAAIQAGANAVYFGVEQLNMRARSSSNFTLEDLKTIVEICNQHKVKSYITLNTILYDHDIGLMKNIVDHAIKHKVSAIIAADHAVINYAHKAGMPVHISTQANVSNIDTVEFYAAFADVIVLARELTLQQVSQIAHEIERRNITGPSGKLVRLEIFAHGALCMAVSGKCYLSLHSHFASANRGACIQNCRRPYIVTDKEEKIEFEIDNEYIMSAKDLCTIDFLDKIVDAGVQVLKLEGRGRPAEYVHAVTKSYREAVDAIMNGSYDTDKVNVWKNELSKVYNRGFWDGYYLGKKTGEWADAHGSKATERKIFIGKCLKYFPKAKVGEFKMQTYSLKVGDKILITGPVTGVVKTTVSELRFEEVPIQKVTKGNIFTLPLDTVIKAADKLYKLVES